VSALASVGGVVVWMSVPMLAAQTYGATAQSQLASGGAALAAKGIKHSSSPATRERNRSMP
jgi:hypothetical protein